MSAYNKQLERTVIRRRWSAARSRSTATLAVMSNVIRRIFGGRRRYPARRVMSATEQRRLSAPRMSSLPQTLTAICFGSSTTSLGNSPIAAGVRMTLARDAARSKT
jgi:hypothetical protein